jgi:hypothetical protein
MIVEQIRTRYVASTGKSFLSSSKDPSAIENSTSINYNMPTGNWGRAGCRLRPVYPIPAMMLAPSSER